jgi:bifunctional non-homologous end joining protein LigD
MTLREYRRKRDFSRTVEPSGRGTAAGAEAEAGGGRGLYVIQKHLASHLHYDLRLEFSGVLKSWAVPKGPSLDPKDKRLAVEVEDHPLEYAGFEGTVPEGEYGAGSVIIWDRGTYHPAVEGKSMDLMLAGGAAKIFIHGQKLRGVFALVRTKWKGKKTNWLLIKEKDDFARPGYSVTDNQPLSVLSGRDISSLITESK